MRAEFEQHFRASLFVELRALFSGVSNDSKYAALGSQMKDFVEDVFDSGLADEAFSRTVNSFKRRRTSAGEDDDLNDDLDRVAVQATTNTESFRSHENPTESIQVRPWSLSSATATDVPLRDTSPFLTTDNCDSGANAYDNEPLEPRWLYDYIEPGIIQTPLPDTPAMGSFDQPDPLPPQASTRRKRRASMTLLDGDEKE